MFFISKILSCITQPIFWLAIWWGISLILFKRYYSFAIRMNFTGLIILGLLGFQYAPDALLRSLENQYPTPSQNIDKNYEGIILLGGSFGQSDLFKDRGQVPLRDGAERLTASLELMRLHPHYQLVFTGGEGLLLPTGITEADLAKSFFHQQGLEPRRMIFEDRSRNTRENAHYVKKLLGERCNQNWLLVTSAWHMPRAVSEFKWAQCNVLPYPVDFRTAHSTAIFEYSMARSLVRWQLALHEI
jgi:uncharacterized SAM-binding protein YcdF (DUF218 family)